MLPVQTNRRRAVKSGLNRVSKVLLANKAARMPAALAGLALTAFTVGALLPYGQKAAQSGPVSTDKAKAAKSAAKTPVVAAAPSGANGSGGSRRSIDFYTGDVRGGMFSEPVSPAPPEPPVSVPKPVRPASVDPFADWNYTGSATIGDEKVAILENINTHDGVLLHVGDRFLDRKVSEIDGSLLTFGGPKPKSLFISMNTSYIPLSTSAAFLTAKPAQPQNAGMIINFMPQNAAANGPASGPSVTLPNGTVLSGNALTRYNRRLNRGWNGNGGGGGGGNLGRGNGG